MGLPKNASIEGRLEFLLNAAERLGTALEQAGLEYRIVGGLAVFIHVDRVEFLAARLTRDVNVAVRRGDLERVVEIANAIGLPAFGKILCIGERVNESDLLPVPGSAPERTAEGLVIAPVGDLIVMKPTAFRLIDKVHIQDMDAVRLITAKIEASLPEALNERLREVRATR